MNVVVWFFFSLAFSTSWAFLSLWNPSVAGAYPLPWLAALWSFWHFREASASIVSPRPDFSRAVFFALPPSLWLLTLSFFGWYPVPVGMASAAAFASFCLFAWHYFPQRTVFLSYAFAALAGALWCAVVNAGILIGWHSWHVAPSLLAGLFMGIPLAHAVSALTSRRHE